MPVKEQIQSFLSPILLSVIGFLVYQQFDDLNEIKRDVKYLMAQSNVDKTELNTLKYEVRRLNNAVFRYPTVDTVHPSLVVPTYFRHEEEKTLDQTLVKEKKKSV